MIEEKDQVMISAEEREFLYKDHKLSNTYDSLRETPEEKFLCKLKGVFKHKAKRLYFNEYSKHGVKQSKIRIGQTYRKVRTQSQGPKSKDTAAGCKKLLKPFIHNLLKGFFIV